MEDTPPSEFRIFRAGWNETDHGRFLFDELAAKSVLEAQAREGVDRMIDLEHLSVLQQTATNYDPDARGWTRLEVRDGELWAVGVKWTEDGAARLSQKRQRYISPVFAFERTSRRVIKVINIAICAMPATHHAQPLVAASVSAEEQTNVNAQGAATVKPEDIKAALEAIKNGDSESALAILEAMLVAAASGDAASEEPADAAAPTDAPPPEMAAAASKLVRLSGKTTIVEALTEVETWRASHVELEEQRVKLAKEQKALEAGERRKLVAELVALGAETPHTSGLASNKLVARLANEDLAELKGRVAELRVARGALGGAPKPPTGPVNGLSEVEIAKCKAKGIDPAKYAETRARIAARNGRNAATEN